MSAAQVTITIDRTSLGLEPLVLSGHDTSIPFALTEPVVIPGQVWRVTYMPDAPGIHGTEPVEASLQQGIISFRWFYEGAVDEAATAAARAEVQAAVGQFSYTVTTKEGNAPTEAWRAHPGSVERPERDYVNLANKNPVFPVTIPVYPIAGTA